MPVFAFLGVFQHEVALQQLRKLVDAVRALAGSSCVVMCNTGGLFANAARLDSQVEVLFESGIDLVFPGEQAIARGAARSLVGSERWPMVRPLNLPVDSPGQGALLLDRHVEPVWVVSVLDGSGRIPVEPAHTVLENFFRNKSDKLPVVINVHGNDFDYKRALAWKYGNSGHQICWFGSGGGPLSAYCEIMNDGSFYQPEVGKAASRDSIGGLAPDIWWKRRIDRLPVSSQPGWGAWRCDCTFLWLDINGKAQKFRSETFEF
jgi:calcineurin-like phosphoesterase